MRIGDNAGRTRTVTARNIELSSELIDTGHRQRLDWVDQWMSR